MEERSLLLLAGLLLGLLVAALVASVLAVRRLGQRQLELKAATEVRLDKLNQRLAEYQQSHIRMGEELISLRNKLSQLENKQQRLEQQDMHTMHYNQASRQVENGRASCRE